MGFIAFNNSDKRGGQPESICHHAAIYFAGHSEKAEAARKVKSVSPAALAALGVGATISELATALDRAVIEQITLYAVHPAAGAAPACG